MNKIERDTLRWINRIRRKLDLDELSTIERGRAGAACNCPVARSIIVGSKYEAIVGPCNADVIAAGERILDLDLPGSVRSFVRSFDHGKYKQYRIGV
jgi:hypothetical protein